MSAARQLNFAVAPSNTGTAPRLDEDSPPPCGEGLGVGGNPTANGLESPPPSLPHKGGGTATENPAELSNDDTVTDLRFRKLLGEEAWARLPDAVRRRFSKRWRPGDIVVYQGHVVATELSRMGRLLSFLARAIGAPLPLTDGMTGPAVVAVTENPALGGQTWTRTYARSGAFPQVIHSAKRFSGPTGLEEYVGYGFGMTLRVTEEKGALVFRSERYFFEVGSLRWQIPRFAEPGTMEIVHRDEGEGRFSFRLTLTRPLAGKLMHQLAYFHDP